MCRILLNAFEKNQAYSKELCYIAVDTDLQPKKPAWALPIRHSYLMNYRKNLMFDTRKGLCQKKKSITIRKDNKL